MAKSVKTSSVVKTWRDNPSEKGEDFTGRVSLAVPNQSMTIKELVDKHSRGVLELPEADHFFLDDDEIPNWEFLPKIEQLEYASVIRHTVAKRKQELKKLEEAGEKVKPEDVPKLTSKIDPPPPSEDD